MKLTYANKVAINENAEIPDINKITDSDMNEIKNVVNNNDDDMITINTILTNATTYSTDEIRVGTWMNKPLYRKVYYVNAFANNSNVYLDINVENVDTVISANGYAKNSSHTETIFLNSSYSNVIHDSIVWEESSNKIRLHTTSDRSGYSGYVWIEYTKTTD